MLYQFSKHSTNLSILRYTPKSRRIIRQIKVKISPYFYKSLVEGACSAFVRSLYLWYEMSTDQKYFCSRCCYFFHRWVNISWYLCYVRIDANNVKIYCQNSKIFVLKTNVIDISHRRYYVILFPDVTKFVRTFY
jgi:hypothetical protein